MTRIDSPIIFADIDETHYAEVTQRVLRRAYDFNKGDRRMVATPREAIAEAQKRAAERGLIQQLRVIEGPLLGQTMWLIQDTTYAAGVPAEVEVPFTDVLSLGDIRALVGASKHLPDSALIQIRVKDRFERKRPGYFGELGRSVPVLQDYAVAAVTVAD